MSTSGCFKFLGLLACLTPAPLLAPVEARAQMRIGAGPGLGIAPSGSGAGVIGEATLSLATMGPHVSVGHLRHDSRGYSYGEVAAWMLLTVGAGGGRWTDGRTAGHVFLGCPVPIVGMDGENGRITAELGGAYHGGLAPVLIYVEPAYRWFVWGASGGQFELLLKASLGLRSW